MRRTRPAAAALAAAFCACAAGRESATPLPYLPDRRDDAAFRARRPDVLEPNYLAFMTHRAEGRDGGEILLLCRWPDEAMPLPIYVAAPEIPESLQDEFDPKDPEVFVEAVRGALATWEHELEGLVRFRLVGERRDARLELRLLGEQAPDAHPDLQVLGATPIARACHVRGGDPAEGRLDVTFEVPKVDLYIADYFGLLAPDQVEWIALHEIGHALGMRSHSPIPADVMYEVVRDRVTVRELSQEDVNSFVSLYRLPNGTLYARAPAAGEAPRPPPPLPQGPPELALAPYVDARLGFELRPPAGWMRVPTAQGMVAVDGVTWDYSASFQIVVHRYPTLEAFMDRYGGHLLARGRVVEQRFLTLQGRRAFEIRIEHRDARLLEQMTFIEAGDGRVFAVIADSPVELAELYRPWFEAALGALEIR